MSQQQQLEVSIAKTIATAAATVANNKLNMARKYAQTNVDRTMAKKYLKKKKKSRARCSINAASDQFISISVAIAMEKPGNNKPNQAENWPRVNV